MNKEIMNHRTICLDIYASVFLEFCFWALIHDNLNVKVVIKTSRNFVSGNWTETPLKSYHVQSGEKYRFRVIHPGTIFPLRVSIDGHMLNIVAMDGYDVVPIMFESFIINPGERFDFILSADQPIGDYWIRVDGMEVHFRKSLSLTYFSPMFYFYALWKR